MTMMPAKSKIHPETDLPLKNKIPIPKISGINDKPNVLYPQSVQ